MSTTSQQVLAVLGQRLGVVQNQEIEEAANLDHEQVKSAIRTLVRRGYAERRGELRVKATLEGIAFLEAGKEITSGPNGPRVIETEGTNLRARLWKAIRLAQKASVSELLELAARGSESNAAVRSSRFVLRSPLINARTGKGRSLARRYSACVIETSPTRDPY